MKMFLLLLLPFGCFTQAQPMQFLNAVNYSPSPAIHSNSQSLNQSDHFQFLQNLQTNLQASPRRFASQPNLLSMRNHRLSPSLPLINLNTSGKGPVIVGLDSQAQRHPQNNSYLVRQGVQYINGFGGQPMLNFNQNQNLGNISSNVNCFFSFLVFFCQCICSNAYSIRILSDKIKTCLRFPKLLVI